MSALLFFLNKSSNAFMLPEGMVSITMDDVVSITNFSPIGNEVSALETYPPHVKNIYQWPGPTAYSRFIKQEKRSTEEMNPQEEISFYLYWVCKFLVCNQVQKSFIPVAETLFAADCPVALAPFLLGLAYSLLIDGHRNSIQRQWLWSPLASATLGSGIFP
ncbi:hypothetical protein SO802_035302 [Lithocarpus litseifolius]|uniref:Aminotransferase-like plant mobile domain-containing protein n=1 Tax=Lithocarpus litseifolius TaxID=425828 RepID=A0AAW2BCJ8_9ROSI